MSSARWVIKVGGAILDDAAAADALFRALSRIDGAEFALVHGGGALVDRWLAAAGHTTERHRGLRVSPEAQMPWIVGGLAGCANRQLIGAALRAGLRPFGMSLYEAGVELRRAEPPLGEVGEVVGLVDTPLRALVRSRRLPIVCSIGHCTHGSGADESPADGAWLNVNADDAAVAVARQLDAELAYLTDVEAVRGPDEQPIRELDSETFEALATAGVVAGGMAVKVRAALSAAEVLSRPVAIASWRHPDKLAELMAGAAVGTRVLPRSDPGQARPD